MYTVESPVRKGHCSKIQIFLGMYIYSRKPTLNWRYLSFLLFLDPLVQPLSEAVGSSEDLVNMVYEECDKNTAEVLCQTLVFHYAIGEVE